MKDMFYNYEHNINHKEYSTLMFEEQSNKVEDTVCVKELTNAKGEILGISAKENARFYLYFNFQLADFEDNDLDTILAEDNLHFDVLDFKHEVVASFKVELSDYSNSARVKIVTSENGPLKYGVYKMHLYSKVEENIYTLFSTNNNILYIE